MNNFKYYAFKIGEMVATLLTIFGPILILFCYKEIGKYWWIWLIASVCYSFYSFVSIVEFNDLMKKNRKLYENVLNGKTIESDTEEKKLNWYKVICIDIIYEYFKYRK